MESIAKSFAVVYVAHGGVRVALVTGADLRGRRLHANCWGVDTVACMSNPITKGKQLWLLQRELCQQMASDLGHPVHMCGSALLCTQIKKTRFHTVFSYIYPLIL